MLGIDIILFLVCGFLVGYVFGAGRRDAHVRMLTAEKAELEYNVSLLEESNRNLWKTLHERNRNARLETGQGRGPGRN